MSPPTHPRVDDPRTALTPNRRKTRVMISPSRCMLFITHAMPKALKIDEVVQLTKDGAQRLKLVDQDAAARRGPARNTPRPAQEPA